MPETRPWKDTLVADPNSPDQTDPDQANDGATEATGDEAQAATAAAAPDAVPLAADDASGDQQSSTADIEQRLDDAAESLEQAAGEGVSVEGEAKPYSLGALSPSTDNTPRQPIDLVGEVEMDLRIELGRTQMRLEEVLHLRGGSVVALDKLAGDPVDVFANGRLIARGEVLVMNDNFCIRVTELVGA
jgi:flagellar motor switch protein FliN/FliY